MNRQQIFKLYSANENQKVRFSQGGYNFDYDLVGIDTTKEYWLKLKGKDFDIS